MSRASSSSSSASAGLASWPAARHTLFLRVHSADKLQLATSTSSYCKVYLGDSPVVNAPHSTVSSMFLTDRDNLPEHRSFHTKVCTSQVKTVALWNEKFEVPVENVKKEILSLRVKSQHPLYSPSIGSCAIQLKQLRPGTTVDQNFPLFKGDKTVGTLRLQLMIRENGGALEDPVQKKSSKTKKHKDVDHRSEEERALEDENKEFLRRQREKEQQLAREKKRIEDEMERLRREEEERTRRRLEEEERRRIEAERVAAAEAEKQRVKEEKLRQKALKKEQEAEVVRRLSESISRRKCMISNQANSSFDDQWSSEQTMSMDDDCRSESADTMSRTSSRSTQGFNSMHRASSGRSRRSTLSLTDMIDTVVQDALPSDSDDSDRLDTEDEQEFIRKIAKLKIKMIQKRKQRQTQREFAQEAERKAKAKATAEPAKDRQRRRKKRAGSSCSSSSSSSSSPSSCCSSEEEEEEEEEEVKPVRQSVQVIKQKKKTTTRIGNQADADNSSGFIQSLTPVQITKKTGRDQSNQLNVGQIFEAAVNVAKVVAFDDEEDSVVEDGIPDTVDALHSLLPIGKFLGQKLHEASAKVAQLNEPKQPTYYF